MFRRSKSDTTAETTPVVSKPGGKGRPTPSRKEAEAAARARAKAPRTRKEIAAAQREARSESSARMRSAMRSGDDRYLPPRDKGPVKRFVRDFVDARLSFIELMLPILLVTLVLGWSGNTKAAGYANAFLMATMLLIVMDLVLLRFRLKRQLSQRFPDASHKGLTRYAVMRALQMKFMRLPKAQVKFGEKLPDTYR